MGLENYAAIWDDLWKPRSDVRAAFTNTLGYVLYGVPAQMVLALAVALLLDRIRVLSTLFRVAYFAPYVTSAVAVAFVWNWLYLPQTGLLAQVFDLLRIPEQPFTKSPDQALASIAAVAVWQTLGYSVIIYLAGIKQIPATYYEAAPHRRRRRGAAVPAHYAAPAQPRHRLPHRPFHHLVPAALRPGAEHEPAGHRGTAEEHDHRRAGGVPEGVFELRHGLCGRAHRGAVLRDPVDHGGAAAVPHAAVRVLKMGRPGGQLVLLG